MRFFLILHLLLLFACTGCQSKSGKADEKHSLIMIKDDHSKKLAFNEVFAMKQINLEATQSTLLLHPFRILVANEYIYALNRSGGIFVCQYDTNGRLLHVFATQGAGPGDLQAPIDICQINQEIIIADGGDLSLKRYNIKGEFVGQIEFTEVGFKCLASDGRENIIVYHGQPGFKHPITIFNLSSGIKKETGIYNPINVVQNKFHVQGICYDRKDSFYTVFAKESVIYKFNLNGELTLKLKIPEAYFKLNNIQELLSANQRNRNDNFTRLYFSSPRIIGIFFLDSSILCIQIEETVRSIESITGFRMKWNLLICSTNGELRYFIEDIPYKVQYSDGRFLYATRDLGEQEFDKILNPLLIRFQLKDVKNE